MCTANIRPFRVLRPAVAAQQIYFREEESCAWEENNLAHFCFCLKKFFHVFFPLEYRKYCLKNLYENIINIHEYLRNEADDVVTPTLKQFAESQVR